MSRRIIAVAVAACLIMAIIWSVAIRSPQSKAIKRAHADQAVAAKQVASLQGQVAALQRQTAGLPAVQAQLAALKQALPAQAALDQVIDAVQQASVLSGVVLANLSQSVGAPTPASAAASPATGNLGEVHLIMSASGTYSQLMVYLTRLGSLARTMVVDNLSLGSSATGKMSAQITGRMFFVSGS